MKYAFAMKSFGFALAALACLAACLMLIVLVGRLIHHLLNEIHEGEQ